DPVPVNTKNAYNAGDVTLSAVNGNPTASGPKLTLMGDKVTSDPTLNGLAPPSGSNLYMLQMYLSHVLPKAPDLSLIWFRSPDSPEHQYGPGSYTYRDALKNQDALLGQLQAALKARGWDKTTDLIVVSDHGHSSVSGDSTLFPLRAITTGAVGDVDATNGWSVSGDVRIADLIKRSQSPSFTGIAIY